jgi:hypothetical protein
LVELQQACPLLLDGHVLLVVVKLGNLARRVRPVRSPDWLSLPAEVDRRVRLAVCLFQMVTANRLPVVQLVLQLHDRVCLLRLAKPVLRPHAEPLHPRQLPAAGSLLSARQRQLAEERSSGSRF